MNLKLKNIFYAGAAVLFLAGCGGHPSAHKGERVFQGEVARVQYQLTEGVTLLFDAEGKQVAELNGFPGIPSTEVEIYKLGGHEYEVFMTKEPLAPQ